MSNKHNENPGIPILSIGLMSGTSLDGIDASIVYTDGEEIIDLGLSIELPIPVELRKKIFGLSQRCKDNIAFAKKCANDQLSGGHKGEIRSVELELTALHAEVCNNLLDQHEKQLKNNSGYLSRVEKSQRERLKVTVIGFHGQTIFHHPNDNFIVEENQSKMDNKDLENGNAQNGRFTWQLGDGEYLSKLCNGIKVVSQFRFQDINAGGEGAPLAPLYHVARLNSDLICRSDKEGKNNQKDGQESGLLTPTAIVNIGGVANVTFVRRDNKPPLAFDCGPGNALIDDWIRFKSNGKNNYDADGAMANNGKIHEDIVNNAIYTHGNYLSKVPPKSLDRNEFQILFETVSARGINIEDGAATLTRFTACCISLSTHFLDKHDRPKKWLICGGGRKNQTLMQDLKEELCTNEVIDVDALGWRGDAVEAECFAYLAVRVLYNKFTSLPTTTNCKIPVCGGLVH
jgi:anhydro-N-acetylmuramic acid kinase